ncbi:MAG: hypothetical protein HOV80_38225, partial [Polyangiaceae bacterium]|nr:hypothetical protein [Polyangiaceae bacterium]
QSAIGPLASVLAIAREVGGDTAESPAASAGQLSRLLESLARDAPCVLCLDDAHLADAESLELFEAALLATAPGTRLLVVESVRGEHSAGASSLALGELSDDDVALLIASRLGARLVPPELFEALVDRTGGHPLFLEEALQTLVAGALVDVHDGVARLRDGAEIRLPASFEALARARVKELDASSRRVLAAAAVSGPGAPPERVAALAGLPPSSEEEIVWQLVRGGFARRDDDGGLHLSAVYADAVLSIVGHEDEVELCRAAAQALAQSSTFEDLAARAGHLERAGDVVEAARAHLAAAQAAKAQGAGAAAAGHLARALGGLDTAADVEHAVEQLAELGPTQTLGIDVEDALAHALEVIDTSPSAAARASVRLTLARLLGRAPESAWVLLDAAAAIEGHDPAELARARVAVARAAGYPARGIEAARLLVGAVDADPASLRDAAQLAVWARETELARGALARADAVSPAPRRLLGEALSLEGKAEEAELELARALRDLRKGDDREEHARAALSYAAILLGDAGRRFSALSEASRAARSAGNREIVEMAAMHLDAFSASDDAESIERLDRRTSAARVRGWTLGSLVGATLSAEVGGASRETAGALAREATDLGHAVLAARLAAVAVTKRSDDT